MRPLIPMLIGTLIENTAVANESTNFSTRRNKIQNTKTTLPLLAFIVGFLAIFAIFSFPASATLYNYTEIDPFSSNYVQAFSINDSGDIVGSYVDPASGIQSGFLYSNGTFSRIQFPTAGYNTLNSIADFIDNN